MNELKPCPFCGGAAHFVNTPESESGVCVECERCLTSSRVIYPSKQDPFPELAQAWNLRQPDSITCDEHEWPYGFNIDGDNRPKCVWCESLRADELERRLVKTMNKKKAKSEPTVAAKCIECGSTKQIKANEVRPDEMPMCNKCGSVMLAQKATP